MIKFTVISRVRIFYITLYFQFCWISNISNQLLNSPRLIPDSGWWLLNIQYQRSNNWWWMILNGGHWLSNIWLMSPDSGCWLPKISYLQQNFIRYRSSTTNKRSFLIDDDEWFLIEDANLLIFNTNFPTIDNEWFLIDNEGFLIFDTDFLIIDSY